MYFVQVPMFRQLLPLLPHPPPPPPPLQQQQQQLPPLPLPSQLPQASYFSPWYPPPQQQHQQRGECDIPQTPEDAIRLANAAVRNPPRPGVVPAAWSYTQLVGEGDDPELYAKANQIQRIAAEQFRKVNGWLPKELMYRTKLCSFYYYTGFCQKG